MQKSKQKSEKSNLKETKIMQGKENFKLIINNILTGIRDDILMMKQE